MDTRRKILTPAAAAEKICQVRARGHMIRLVIGHFDPLLAGHARRLAEISASGDPLMVAVTSPPEPLLPVEARAELVAGLAMVDYVIPADQAGLETILELLEPGQVFREEEADRRLTQKLIRHVHSRRENA